MSFLCILNTLSNGVKRIQNFQKKVFVAMGKYDVMSRDPGNENHVTPVIFLILIS